MQPVRTTGSSILGTVFDGGVMIAADTRCSYGSVARFLNYQRVTKINENIILGACGDLADFQYVRSFIDDEIITEQCYNDGFSMKPKSLLCWLTRLMYQRRSELDPLWNSYVVGGMQDGEPFLGCVDKIGTVVEAPVVATDVGSKLALPILRGIYEERGEMSITEAKQAILECMEILYYRDALSYDKYHLGIATSEGTFVEGPILLDTDWQLAYYSKN